MQYTTVGHRTGRLSHAGLIPVSSFVVSPIASAAAGPVVLHPGDVRCGTRGDQFATLLGSCVAIMLTDPRGTVGAMCHFVVAGTHRVASMWDTRDADDALQAMFDGLQRLGIHPQRCLAHVAGGGNMFPDRFACGSDIGAANAAAALELLGERGMVVVSRSLGGACYRKVLWTIGASQPDVECFEI